MTDHEDTFDADEHAREQAALAAMHEAHAEAEHAESEGAAADAAAQNEAAEAEEGAAAASQETCSECHGRGTLIVDAGPQGQNPMTCQACDGTGTEDEQLRILWHRYTTAGGLKPDEQITLDLTLAERAVNRVLAGHPYEGKPIVKVPTAGAEVDAPVPARAYQEMLAWEYASARRTMTLNQEALDRWVAPFMEDLADAQAALEATPEWAAVQAAKEAAEKAGQEKADALRVEAVQMRADRCKDALVALYAAVGADGVEKTVPVPEGRVSYSPRKGVKVTDGMALARDLLERELWDLAEAKLTVKASSVRPLAEGKSALRGLAPADTVTVAFTPKKESA